MKCPKCNYVSFDYLSECRKCGKDMGPFKAEMGIDFVKPLGLGILQFFENGGTASAVAVAEDVVDTEVTTAHAAESKAGGGGASLSADDLLAEIEEGGEPAVAAAEEEGGISFSLPDETEDAVSVAAVEDSGGIALDGLDLGTQEGGISLDLGDDGIGIDLDLGGEETRVAKTPSAKAPAAEEEGGISFDLDLGGDLDESIGVDAADEGIQIASDDESAISLGGEDDLSLNLGDVETEEAVPLDGGGLEVSTTGSDDLGGLDLDLSLGSEEETAAMGGVELDLGTAPLDEQELDLSLGEEPSVSLDEDVSTEISGGAGTQEIALGGLGDLDLNLDEDAIDLGGLGSKGPAKDKKSDLGGLDDLDLQLDDDEVKLG